MSWRPLGIGVTVIWPPKQPAHLAIWFTSRMVSARSLASVYEPAKWVLFDGRTREGTPYPGRGAA